jgi:hypothetical protein
VLSNFGNGIEKNISHCDPVDPLGPGFAEVPIIHL